MQAMILAAGFGTRLKPYSLIKPKPLFPVLNTPLLVAVVRRLQNAGFTSITVNCHHLSSQIIAALEDFHGVIIQEEPEILGTGGSLRQAMDHLSDEPLLVTNGDIYHTIDCADVYEKHRRSDSHATMVLHDCPRFNTVLVSERRVLGFRSMTAKNQLAFTGIQVVDPVLLSGIAPGRYSCIIDHYRKCINEGVALNYELIKDCMWTDMGTPEDYLGLHAALLNGTMEAWPELEALGTGSVLIDGKCSFGAGSVIEEWGCVGNAVIENDVTISRSVIWDGAHVSANTRVSDCIVMPRRKCTHRKVPLI